VRSLSAIAYGRMESLTTAALVGVRLSFLRFKVYCALLPTRATNVEELCNLLHTHIVLR
jgi:hypothetical protein